MTGKYSRRYAAAVSKHSKAVILLVLMVTAGVAAGAAFGDPGDGGFGEFDIESPETEAQQFITNNYGTDEDSVTAQLVVRDRGGNVLTQDALLDGLYLQQAVTENETLAATLSEDGFIGIENIVGTVAAFEDAAAEDGPPPTEHPSLAEQITALEDRSAAEVDALVAEILDPDGDTVAEQDIYDFLPQSYEPGETEAEARLTLITQVDDSGDDEEPQAAFDAQVAIDELVQERFTDAFVFGQGIQDAASASATGDSFAIIVPFALALVLIVLGIAYRDVIDIMLAFFGISVVMAWLAGIMGWLQIPMNVILIAVPFLLIGLSIDYALHVVMRYREAREGSLQVREGQAERTPAGSIRSAMALGLGSVILALGAATFSTGTGFLSNVVSPLPAIQDFALLSAGGILATFVAFGLLLPALKVELEGFLENRLGWDRRKPAFGVASGRVNDVLGRLGSLTTRTPVAIIIVALLLGTAGAYGATTIDTEFNEADFLPQDAPDWAAYLPGPFAPGSYTIADDFAYLSENFRLQGGGGQAEILIREDVTSDSVLGSIDAASDGAPTNTTIQRGVDGSAAIEGPHTVIRNVAADNESFSAVVDRYDQTGNGLPDENAETVYDALFAADEAAASNVLSRNDAGEITSARLILSVRGDASSQAIATDIRGVASAIENEAPGVSAIATGAAVTTAVIQDALLETLVQAFIVTLVVIAVFLTALFYLRYRSLTQGMVVLAPVVVSLAWLLGAMAALDIPFNSETAVITSLAIGLGVDYSIHAGERFMEERERCETVDEALDRMITGTGGALLASACTTAAGFGVLALSLSPPLQRFGIVTAAAIFLAFLAVVTLLPGLLILRERVASR